MTETISVEKLIETIIASKIVIGINSFLFNKLNEIGYNCANRPWNLYLVTSLLYHIRPPIPFSIPTKMFHLMIAYFSNCQDRTYVQLVILPYECPREVEKNSISL